MVPCEISFGQHVRKLIWIFGSILILQRTNLRGFWIRVSSLDSFFLLKDAQLRLALTRICVCGELVVHMRQLINIFVRVWICFLANKFLLRWLVRFGTVQ